MTDIADTIEEQLKELERQYKHAQQVISGMSEMLRDQKFIINQLEMKCAAKQAIIGEMEKRLCKCDGGGCE